MADKKSLKERFQRATKRAVFTSSVVATLVAGGKANAQTTQSQDKLPQGKEIKADISQETKKDTYYLVPTSDLGQIRHPWVVTQQKADGNYKGADLYQPGQAHDLGYFNNTKNYDNAKAYMSKLTREDNKVYRQAFLEHVQKLDSTITEKDSEKAIETFAKSLTATSDGNLISKQEVSKEVMTGFAEYSTRDHGYTLYQMRGKDKANKNLQEVVKTLEQVKAPFVYTSDRLIEANSGSGGGLSKAQSSISKATGGTVTKIQAQGRGGR